MINRSEPIHGLGRTSARLLTTLAGRDQYIFTTQDAVEILGVQPDQHGRAAVVKLLHDLVKRRWIERLEKGKYLIIPFAAGPRRIYTTHAFLIAAHLVEPYYIGYWSSLHYHGFTEQLSHTIFVATTKQKRERTIAGVTYRFVTLTPHKFFGYRGEWIEGRQIQVADREKTIVDCLDHLEYCGGIVEAAKGLWYGVTEKRLDLDRLTEYATRVGNRAVFKRLGYLAEVLELPIEEYVARWRGEISRGYSLLDPTLGGGGERDGRWRLWVNVPREALLEWREH